MTSVVKKVHKGLCLLKFSVVRTILGSQVLRLFYEWPIIWQWQVVDCSKIWGPSNSRSNNHWKANSSDFSQKRHTLVSFLALHHYHASPSWIAGLDPIQQLSGTIYGPLPWPHSKVCAGGITLAIHRLHRSRWLEKGQHPYPRVHKYCWRLTIQYNPP